MKYGGLKLIAEAAVHRFGTCATRLHLRSEHEVFGTCFMFVFQVTFPTKLSEIFVRKSY